MTTPHAPVEQRIAVLSRKITSLESEVDCLRVLVEDSILTADEARFLDEVFTKIRKGDTSDFVRIERFQE